MKCPACHFENPETSRFCAGCGTGLSTPQERLTAVTETLQAPVQELTPGSTLAGRYRVIDELGAGGMGKVYRALDKNLGRQVAIKILPAAFAEDKERMARFEREAKLLAVMNHPHIAAIHGFEESEGRRFLVLELAEGKTLKARLNRGALPVEEALEVCREIAEGLEAAHEKGIVHRDLKPGNIIITPEGKVKILDFGLAKAYGAETTSSGVEESPTITAGMTEPGVILGTAAYMSPEQARSRPVDKRTDIWSFGCVLYECLTGARAFHGETVSDTLAHILKGEPDWSKLPQETPIRIRTLLRHCLEKNPKERLRDIGDARIEIAEALRQVSASEEVVVHRPVRAWILPGLIGGLVVGGLATFVTWHIRPAPSPAVGCLTLKLNPGLWLDGVRRVEFQRPTRTAFALSSDGRFIVYSAIVENPGPQAKPQIYLRRMDQMEAVPVAGTEGGICPFLSPDGKWIGFWADGGINKVPVGGGVPIPLCDGTWDAEDWGPDNMIVFSSNGGLSRISSEGGKPEVLTVPEQAMIDHKHILPYWLPDGRGVVFTVVNGRFGAHPNMAVLDLESRKWRVIVEDAADGRYIRTGHLVFLRQGTLMAIGFDLDRREVKGQPVPIVANVMQALNMPSADHNSGAGQYSVSNSGSLAYAPGGIFPDLQNSLVRVSQKGVIQSAVDFKAPLAFPRFSPDGQRIGYQTIGMEKQISIYDLNRASTSRLIGEEVLSQVVWSHDGKRVVFGWTKSGVCNLYWAPADGSSPMERLTTSDKWQCPGSFTPDDAVLAFVELNPDTGYNILFLDMKSRKVTPFLSSKAYQGFPEFSPNGHWLAYSTYEFGRYEVWVQPFPGPGGKWQVSKEGGWQPIWSKDGGQLFYRQGGQVWAVDVRSEGGFSAGKPRLLFEQSGIGGGVPIRNWDLWPDGQGFLMVKNDERKPDPVAEITIVQNWFEELKRLVPAGKK